MKAFHLSAAALVAGLSALAAPAFAHDVFFIATLSGAAEAPANASLGTGTAFITVNEDDFTIRVQTTFSGLSGNVTASHIHCCTATPGVSTAGVATQTPTFVGFPLGATFGTYDHTFDMSLAASWNPAFITANGGSTGTAFSVLMAGIESGRAYLNIHSTVVPGGEIRGFIHAAPVPEPETYGLMLSGLGVLAWVTRRQRRQAQDTRA